MARRLKIDIEREEQEAEERRQYERYMRVQASLGWKPMAGEPLILPMWQCLRCSTLAFDKEVHDEFHQRIGD